MITALRTPARRVAFCIALSALIHAAVLWLPYMQFHHDRMQPPPLTVRIEHLPKPNMQPAKMPEPATPLTRQHDNTRAKPVVDAMGAMNKIDETPGAQRLPRQLRLTFAVYQDGNSLRAGEIDHQLDIRGNSYTLQSLEKATGLNSLQDAGRLILTSRGRIGEHGLQPEIFEEENITAEGTERRQAIFDREARKLRFSNGDEAALPADAQDILSFMYQLSQLPVREEYFELPVIDSTRLERYQIEIGVNENISTPMGKLRTLQLRKLHKNHEAYFEIWLGRDYRLLPVRYRQTDSAGHVTREFLITDIRSSDE